MTEYTEAERERVAIAAKQFGGHVTIGSLSCIIAEVQQIEREHWFNISKDILAHIKPGAATSIVLGSVPQADGDGR